MHEFYDWFRWLYDATGINLTIFYDSFDRNRFVNGFFTTLKLACACVRNGRGRAGGVRDDKVRLGRATLKPGFQR